MNEFLKKNKKKIIKLLLAVLTLILISFLVLILLLVTKVIHYDSGFKFNETLFETFKNSWYGIFIYIIIQCLLTSVLCAIPGASMAFILLSTFIYPEPWKAFTLSFIGVMLSSCLMYLIGRSGGYKLCCKMLGDEDCEKSLGLLRDRGTIYFPLMMAFPVFPDDALVMIAGTIKMSLKWFIPSIVFGRGIGIATIVFGLSIVPFDSFNTLYDWIVFITVCAFWIIIIFILAHRLNIKLEEKRAAKNNQNK